VNPDALPLTPALGSALADEFPAPSREAWMALVEKTLKGAPFEKRLVSTTAGGVTVRPLYVADDAAPALKARRAPAEDSERPWDLRTVVDHADPKGANAQALKDLENGAASLLLRIDPTGETGVALASADDLAVALNEVLLDLAPVALEAGYHGPQAADWLATLAKGAPEAPLAFHLDPISSFAQSGASEGAIENHIEAAAQVAARHAGAYAKATLFLASGRTVHEAGGSEAQELGFMAAAALAYAKAYAATGASLEDAFARIVLGVSLDGDYFISTAKLRAARALFARLSAACGAETSARIEARSSRRMMSRLDPWVNLLRLTAAGFAGGVGGADAVILESFTQPLGRATEFARRQSRNAQLVLMDEASLGRVADPAGGAWFLETLTDELARAAWTQFQTIEAKGGIIAALTDGSIATDVAAVWARRQADAAKRKTGMVGTSEFANIDEAAVATEAFDVSTVAKTLEVRAAGSDNACPPLTPVRLSEGFEHLRERAAAVEPRPLAYLATLGSPSDFTARVGFARNLLGAGGIATEVGDASAYDGSATVVICSSDERYATEAADVAQALKAKGATKVYLAGRPGELEAALTAAGVDDYLFAGGDVIVILDRVLSVFEEARR
jgi:methylmalonyl-CoA mutase